MSIKRRLSIRFENTMWDFIDLTAKSSKIPRAKIVVDAVLERMRYNEVFASADSNVEKPNNRQNCVVERKTAYNGNGASAGIQDVEKNRILPGENTTFDLDGYEGLKKFLINGAIFNNQTLEDYVYYLVSKDLDYIEYVFFSPGNLKYLNNLAEKNKIPYVEITNEWVLLIKNNVDGFVNRVLKRITGGY